MIQCSLECYGLHMHISNIKSHKSIYLIYVGHIKFHKYYFILIWYSYIITNYLTRLILIIHLFSTFVLPDLFIASQMPAIERSSRASCGCTSTSFIVSPNSFPIEASPRASRTHTNSVRALPNNLTHLHKLKIIG